MSMKSRYSRPICNQKMGSITLTQFYNGFDQYSYKLTAVLVGNTSSFQAKE